MKAARRAGWRCQGRAIWITTVAIGASTGVLAGEPGKTQGAEEIRAAVQGEVRKAAARHRVDPKLAASVAKVESGFQTKARSVAGAIGVMQLMPGTARSLRVNPWDTRQNIDGGVRHLRWLLERYPGNLSAALAAYNAGTGAVDKYGGVPPYRETKRYVGSVLSEYTGVAVEGRAASPKARRRRQSVAVAKTVESCAGTEVVFDAAGRLYVRTRVVGKGCEPMR